MFYLFFKFMKIAMVNEQILFSIIRFLCNFLVSNHFRIWIQSILSSLRSDYKAKNLISNRKKIINSYNWGELNKMKLNHDTL